MGKKKWVRVRQADLASAETQERLLKVMDQVKGQPEPDSQKNRTHETPQEGR